MEIALLGKFVSMFYRSQSEFTSGSSSVYNGQSAVYDSCCYFAGSLLKWMKIVTLVLRPCIVFPGNITRTFYVQSLMLDPFAKRSTDLNALLCFP